MKLAALCYVIDKEKSCTLMLHRIKRANDVHEGKWNGLGGKLELGESPEECVIREVKEESGLTIKSPKLKGFITFPMFDSVDDWYVFVFTAEIYTGEIINSDEGVLEWIPNKKIPELNLWEGDVIFMKWLNDDKFFSAKFNYANKSLTDYSCVFY